MKDNTKILELVLQQVKQILEKMLQEERQIYLEEHPETKGNGYYDRDLQLPFGQLEDLHVPRSQDGRFKSQLLPHRRRSVEETQELVRALLMAGVSTRKIGEILKTVVWDAAIPHHRIPLGASCSGGDNRLAGTAFMPALCCYSTGCGLCSLKARPGRKRSGLCGFGYPGGWSPSDTGVLVTGWQ